MIYYTLALIFGTIHYFWTTYVRNRMNKYISVHIQNWAVRVFLSIIIVSSQGKGLEVLGFKLPNLTVTILISLVFLTVILFIVIVAIQWFAISYAEDAKAIETIKGWTTDIKLKDSLIGPLLWTLPEECFFRGYLVSQFLGLGSIVVLSVTTFFTAIAHNSRGKFWVLLSVFTGLFLGLAFVLSDSLLPPLIIHAIGNNLLAPMLTPWYMALIEKSSKTHN